MIRVVAAANPYRFLHSRVAPGFSPAPLRLDTQLPRGAACPARLCTGTHFVAAHHAAPMLGNSFASQRPRDTAISNGAGRRFFFRAASVSQHRHFERSRPTFFLSRRVRFTAPSFRTEQADFFFRVAPATRRPAQREISLRFQRIEESEKVITCPQVQHRNSNPNASPSPA